MPSSAPPPHSSSLTIRPAVHADGAALAVLDRRTWSSLHAVTPEPTGSGDDFFDGLHLPEHVLVAESADEGPVGYIRIVPASSLPSNAHVRQIQGLAVDVAARGQGVGRALVEAACEESRRQGAVRITLRVLGHNAPAQRLYAACGFAVEGVLPGEFLLDGEYVDDVLMGRALAADTGTPATGLPWRRRASPAPPNP
ncbi:GNAT family N-acetyltransferase [Streptomyces meridianus]|uniref:GNAT family N-acetyltransferase n=1 Tax=Streptomyces meridianus TaxID=2938945 RepID=A0ABT0X1D8_9ACTN|nr:GNAT family N-acetyltransferase [Streptomyces meridianus]MCM2576372.1 GNAT family N-acetyltransferase [Streptomyces meridianus]